MICDRFCPTALVNKWQCLTWSYPAKMRLDGVVVHMWAKMWLCSCLVLQKWHHLAVCKTKVQEWPVHSCHFWRQWACLQKWYVQSRESCCSQWYRGHTISHSLFYKDQNIKWCGSDFPEPQQQCLVNAFLKEQEVRHQSMLVQIKLAHGKAKLVSSIASQAPFTSDHVPYFSQGYRGTWHCLFQILQGDLCLPHSYFPFVVES